ncbi:FAD-binding oxidoreductase [Metabacillus arenae]|uniref:FAD-binding oxidoreductase n=1 Tax=Metabacillus arenae TaxID=2771434 RepID=A0A926RXS8_9BACI|nr:FAD-binding oxidoreductase [Metabacillus arenae]MBD1380462.1 FAD-binding oxidoreductase [Metabacillus arenae]
MIAIDLLSELKAILNDDQIVVGENRTHPLGNSGKVKVFAKSEEDIQNVLKFANNEGLKIAVAGGGTKRGFGGITDSADLLLSLEKYKGIVEHTVGDMTITVKSGTSFKELQEYLAAHNQKVSLDPAWPDFSSIGGIIAANESGPKRLGYGSARDVVIGLRMVYPDGTIIRSGGKVVKNVAGYDMNKLFIGSMGTLAVLSEVTLKLRPLPKYESLVLLSFPDGKIEELRSFVIKLLDSVMEPTSLELLSPSLSKKLTGKHLYTLAISFEDVESSVHYQENFVKNIQSDQTELAIFQQKETQLFWEAFYKICPNGAIPSSEEELEAAVKIGVKNMDVPQVIRECETLRDSYNLEISTHGGLGHGLCQVILKGASEDVVTAIGRLRIFAAQLGGYMVVKHLPLYLRRKVNVWGDNPSYFALLEGIKLKVDPNRVLNDKRFVGGI